MQTKRYRVGQGLNFASCPGNLIKWYVYDSHALIPVPLNKAYNSRREAVSAADVLNGVTCKKGKQAEFKLQEKTSHE